MATATDGHRGALTGPLPPDFLVFRGANRPVPVNVPAQAGPARPHVGAVEDVRTLQVHVQKAILKHNNGMLPMSVYAQVSIGPNALRTTTHNYCGTSPLFEEAVQFGIRQHNPRKILLELYSWGVIKDELLGWAEISLDALYGANAAPAIDRWQDLTGPGGLKVGEVKYNVCIVNTRHAVGETRDGPEPNSLEGRITNILGLN